MDEQTTAPDSALPGESPVFLLSFRQRDELAAAAAGGGWRVVAARRGEGVEQRFVASGANVAVVDARGALSDALLAARALGGVVEANGAAMLVLISQSDTIHVREFLDAGATHFLSSPMSTNAIQQAVRFALRYVERLERTLGTVGVMPDPLGWSFDPELRALQLTPALADLLDLPEAPGVRAALARIDPADRALGRAALRRLAGGTPSTAFAHDLAGVGRVVQHLQRDAATGRLHALVERLGQAPDASLVRDALTGAHDAASARRWVQQKLGEGAGVAAVLIALTRFETVNTAYGRAAGDSLLRAVSRRVADTARELFGRGTVVARMGGSEFLIARDGATPEQTAQAVTRFEEALDRPFVVENDIVPLGARVACVASVPGDSATSLLRRVSEALFDRHVPAESPAPSLDQLAADLRRALDRDQIGVLFQPQVAIATGAIVGAEALARWRHPELGEVGAETLFAAAGHAGLTVALSAHVQSRALAAAARWPVVLSKIRVSINVTAEEVARPGFADSLLGRIDSSGFPRARLTVEITEGSVMADLGDAARLLAELRTAGCRVAIDDFGTGYSSLAYLKALPLDYLKIDKRLSQDIAGSARDRVVVRGVIDMARSLGLAVVAEGVETEEQLELLAKEGCQYFQGFLCAGPLDSDALARLAGARTR
ncbi:putative bifunctional diguanylate cyclase/phosphodiesterase [Sphingomonas canadensis]|uniref:Bifunctional diguanylate cyclase/phosphodiesterase n=1 Tax=Sphingomonas canadensis TaxID=1219257 RepID=A0ABW3HEZ4_9SPHN|nr:bifunctional diguanylate cyclase/phosphodiesterase [Sphingomonas canadensis]MCW3837783.1 bifunctional diguanylate cyclase/phosphodiesterase [Sphingomonas canadensis]